MVVKFCQIFPAASVKSVNMSNLAPARGPLSNRPPPNTQPHTDDHGSPRSTPSICKSRAFSTKERPEVSSRGVVVEYMDRARRATLDIFAQHLPLTLHNAAKLGHFSMGSNGRWRTSEHTRTSNGSIRARSLPYELHCDRYQPTQAKNRAEPALSACVRRRRILSLRAAAAETRQREKVATPSRTADPRASRRVSG